MPTGPLAEGGEEQEEDTQGGPKAQVLTANAKSVRADQQVQLAVVHFDASRVTVAAEEEDLQQQEVKSSTEDEGEQEVETEARAKAPKASNLGAVMADCGQHAQPPMASRGLPFAQHLQDAAAFVKEDNPESHLGPQSARAPDSDDLHPDVSAVLQPYGSDETEEESDVPATGRGHRRPRGLRISLTSKGGNSSSGGSALSSLHDVHRSATQFHRPGALLRTKTRMPVLHPKGTFLKMWKPFIFVAVIVAIVLAPFDVAYHWWEPPSSYKIAGRILDSVFLLDMVVNFNTAVFQHGNLCVSRMVIAKHYARTSLVPDLISNIPLDWFLGGEGKSRKLAKLLKLPKILRFIKLLRAMKDNLEYIGVTAALACLILLGHYGACFWAVALARDCGETEPCPSVSDAYFEALRISIASMVASEPELHFVPSETGTALLAKGRDFGQALSELENVVSAVFNLAGLATVGFLFANVASTLKLRSEASRHRHEMIELRREEMTLAETPRHLQMKVLATYDHIMQYGNFHDGMLRDPMLSLDLRRELAFCMYGDALKSMPIFQDVPDRFLKCLAQKVEMHLYTPGDLIILLGEVGRELFIMIQGSARPVAEDGEYLGDTVFSQGSYFGEVCFLNPGTLRSVSVVCVEFCRVMVLTMDAVQELNIGEVLLETLSGTSPGAAHCPGSSWGWDTSV